MIEERFALEHFEALGLDSPAARELADELAAAVQAELHVVVGRSLKEIVTQLNNLGHNLRLEYEPRIGDISYRDDAGKGPTYRCRLRLGVDVVVSTGFAHLVEGDD